MNKIAFVIWMIGFPLAIDVSRLVSGYLYKIQGEKPPTYSDFTELVMSVGLMSLWAGVGFALWKA